MPLKPYPANHIIVDGENRPVSFDHCYAISDITVSDAMDQLIKTHGHEIGILPLSGCSSGAGILQVENVNRSEVIGLHFTACLQPKVRIEHAVSILAIGLDEIIIDTKQNCVYAGSAITLQQLNQALAAELGSQYRVLGADLTSYSYAQVGATFMTGGMGPQRRYFSDSVIQIALHDGDRLRVFEGEALTGLAGSYGWTGLVSSICCQYHLLPENEIAFALPVNNTAGVLARVLQHFSPFCYLQSENGQVFAGDRGRNLIFGLEHITVEAMEPFLRDGESALVEKAKSLQNQCASAGADGLIFINAFSDAPVDEFLCRLVEDEQVGLSTLAGIGLEHAVIFTDPEQMRAVREGIPYAARMQRSAEQFSYKSHTDVNICLNPDNVEKAMHQLWGVNETYVQAVREFLACHASINGEILEYGHLNPVGVDPHNRITFSCDDKKLFNEVVGGIEAMRNEYFLSLALVSKESDSLFVGAEKCAGSEYAIIPVLADNDALPTELAEKFRRQRLMIHAASPMFNWRAIKPYCQESGL